MFLAVGSVDRGACLLAARVQTDAYQRGDQQRTCEGERFRGEAHRLILQVENAANSDDKSIFGHSQGARPRNRFRQGKRGQRFRVGSGVAGVCHDNLIATHFALESNPRRQPPYNRVEEQERFHNSLHQIDRVVPAADVRQFVEQHHLQLLNAPTAQSSRRQKDHWPEYPHKDRRGKSGANSKCDVAMNS